MSTGPSGTTVTRRGLSATDAGYETTDDHRSPAARALLGGLVLVSLLGALDQAVVSTALPTVVGELGGGAHLAAVVTAYLLAATVATPVWGRWGDRRGRSRPLLAAIGLFIVASALCGLSRSMPELVAWRAVQGMGGAGLAVGTQAVLGELVPARHRPRYLTMFGLLFAAVSVLGPAVGGVITDQLGWRWIFYLNLPVAGAALLVLVRAMPRCRLSGAARAGGRGRPGWAPLRNPVFLTCAAIMFGSGFVILGITVYLPLFFQVVRGVSPTGSGLRLLPLMATSLAVGLTCGWLIGRHGRYKIFPAAGSAVATLGLVLLSWVGPDTPELLVQLGLVVVGIGMGGVGEVLVVVAQDAVPVEELGMATATMAIFRSVGGVLGTAGLGALFTALVAGGLTGGAPGAAPGLTPAQLAGLPAATRSMVVHAYSAALQTLLLVAAGLYAVVFLLILLLPDRRLGARRAAPGERPAAVAADAERRGVSEGRVR